MFEIMDRFYLYEGKRAVNIDDISEGLKLTIETFNSNYIFIVGDSDIPDIFWGGAVNVPQRCYLLGSVEGEELIQGILIEGFNVGLDLFKGNFLLTSPIINIELEEDPSYLSNTFNLNMRGLQS